MFESEETMFLGLQQGNHLLNIKIPNIPCSIKTHLNEVIVTFPMGIEKVQDKLNLTLPITLCSEWTNDPTPSHAGWGISIGYYLLRVTLLNGELVSLNPLTLKGKRADLNILLNRPQRTPLPLHKEIKETYPELSESFEMTREYLIPVNAYGRFHLLCTIIDEKKKNYYNLIEEADFRDFWTGPTCVYFKKAKTHNVALKEHERIKDLWKQGKLNTLLED